LIKYATQELVGIITKYPDVVSGVVDRTYMYLGGGKPDRQEFRVDEYGHNFYDILAAEYLDMYTKLPPEVVISRRKPQKVANKLIQIVSDRLRVLLARKFVSVNDCMVDYWSKKEAGLIQEFVDMNTDDGFFSGVDFFNVDRELNFDMKVIGYLQNTADPDFVSASSEDALFTCLEAYIGYDTKKAMNNIVSCMVSSGDCEYAFYENIMNDI